MTSAERGRSAEDSGQANNVLFIWQGEESLKFDFFFFCLSETVEGKKMERQEIKMMTSRRRGLVIGFVITRHMLCRCCINSLSYFLNKLVVHFREFQVYCLQKN